MLRDTQGVLGNLNAQLWEDVNQLGLVRSALLGCSGTEPHVQPTIILQWDDESSGKSANYSWSFSSFYLRGSALCVGVSAVGFTGLGRLAGFGLCQEKD